MVKKGRGLNIPKLECEVCGLRSSNYDEVSFYDEDLKKLPVEHIEYYLTEGLDEVKHSLCKDCVNSRRNII